jgi:hypothetical protein
LKKDVKSPERAILYPVYDSFDEKDISGSIRKKPDVPEKDLIHFLIRNPSFTLDPTLKSKIHRKSSDFSFETKKTSVSEASTPKTPSTPTTIKSNPLSSKETEVKKRKSIEIQPKSERKGSFSRHASTEPTIKIIYRTEDAQKNTRDKAEKSFNDALSLRIEASISLTHEEKQHRRAILANGLAKEIESKLFELHQSEEKPLLSEIGMKNYLVKFRTLLFNFKDAKNQKLFDSIFSEDAEQKITPEELVRMTSEELARGSELDVWRKEEAKKSLINSVIVAEEPSDGPKLKKTRKGEEEIDTPTLQTKGVSVSDDTFNPLEQILKDIKATTKDKKKEEVEEVPKSPPRHTLNQSPQENNKRKESDASDLVSHIKRKQSSSSFCQDEDSTSSSSNMTASPSKTQQHGVRRVTVNPQLESILSSIPSLAGVVQESSSEQQSVTGTKSRNVWEGFCSGFQESGSALGPGSRFPLVCKMTSESDEVEKDFLHKFSCIPTSLTVIGRINPEQVADYVSKIIEASESSESSEPMVEMVPLRLKKQGLGTRFSGGDEDFEDYSDDDDIDEESILFRQNYDKFVSYLTERKRYAVVDVKSKRTVLKDVYLFPYDIEKGPKFSSSALKRVFKNSPLMNNLKVSKKSALSQKKNSSLILLMLLVKKSSAVRGSKSSVSEPPHKKRTPPQTQRSPLPTVQVAVTLPNHSTPSIVSYTPTPTSILNSFTSQSKNSQAEEEGEYDPGSYLPGLSPEQEDRDERLQTQTQSSTTLSEKELMEKAMIQMRLLQNTS